MLVVRVELWSAVTGLKTEIARMSIANVGGTRTRGDYHARTYRGRSKESLDKAMLRSGCTGQWGPLVTRRGEVKDHARLSLHVWHLVAKSLKACGYAD